MKGNLGLFALGVAALVFTQGACAGVSYQEVANSSDRECNRFLDIVKASRIKDMTNKQLCDAITMPVTELLPNAQFKELDWALDPAANVAEVAKSTIEASEPIDRRPQLEKSDGEWLREVMRLNAAHQVTVAYGRVQLVHKTYYVAQLTEKVCDASYNEYGPLPIFGFFSDANHLHGVPLYPPAGGQLVYYAGHLVAFVLQPEWVSVLRKHSLAVYIQYMVDNPDGSLSPDGKSCQIVIKK